MAEECSKIPVITFPINRLQEFLPGIKYDKILEVIPYAGLDIEGIDAENVRIEYNPNRPDFSSQHGIVRTLKGLLNVEIGLPKFKLSPSNQYVTNVDEGVKELRPYIVSLVAKRKENLSNENIKDLIAMQEDLHNVVGRRRKKASIGIHNLNKIKFPLRYTTVQENFSFTPLDKQNRYTIKQILDELDSGREYGFILKGAASFPIILDSNDIVLSFPPIVNSDATRLGPYVRSILVEVTAVDKHTADDIMAIVAMSLFDAEFRIFPVTISDTITGNSEVTPDMEPKTMQIDPAYINQVLGLSLTTREISSSLEKSRFGGIRGGKKGKLICTIPRYRTDIFHQIDIVEEVAIGYGVFNLRPSIHSSGTSGATNDLTKFFDATREILIGMEMLETLNFSLVSRNVQCDLVGVEKRGGHVISVDGTKSTEYAVLRDSLLPSLLQTLSHNIHEEYPQKLFEIGTVFQATDGLDEHWNVGVVIAHSSASYTEAKSAMEELFKGCLGLKLAGSVSTPPSYEGIFMEGRCANICFKGKNIGKIGEISPEVIENFKLRVPVAAFELDMTHLFRK